VVVLENNAGGQFANVLKLEYGIDVAPGILKYDGDPFSVEEVVKRLQNIT
jgi:2-oxoglutarate/2-oxoacid ferredoxin oxidoreductase subunit alpha